MCVRYDCFGLISMIFRIRILLRGVPVLRLWSQITKKLVFSTTARVKMDCDRQTNPIKWHFALDQDRHKSFQWFLKFQPFSGRCMTFLYVAKLPLSSNISNNKDHVEPWSANQPSIKQHFTLDQTSPNPLRWLSKLQHSCCIIFVCVAKLTSNQSYSALERTEMSKIIEIGVVATYQSYSAVFGKSFRFYPYWHQKPSSHSPLKMYQISKITEIR